MSVSTGARKGASDNDRISNSLIRNEQDFIQRMKPTNVTAATQGPASAGEGTSNAPINDFVETVQAGVEGAINYVQQSLPIDTNQVIHIVRENIDSVFTSFGELTNAVTDGFLDIIDGGDFDGQILKTRIPDGVSNFTINNRNNSKNTTGDIFMAGVENLVTQGGEVVEFIFDAFTTPPAYGQPVGGIPGVWRLSGGASASASSEAILVKLGADQTSNLTAGNHVEFDTVIQSPIGNLTLQTGSGQANGVISGFIAGRVYEVEYGIRVAGTNSSAFMTSSPRNVATSTNFGLIANALMVSSNDNESFIPTNRAIFIPNADTDTLVLQIITSGTVQALSSDSTYLTVTSGFGGSGGSGGGGGGATNLDELTDVTISPNPPTVDGQVLTWVDANQQWENQDPGVFQGATRALDNLTVTALNADINMGSFDITQGKRILFDPGDGAFPDPATNTGFTTDAAKTLISNVPATSNYLWKHNNDVTMALAKIANDTSFEVQTILGLNRFRLIKNNIPNDGSNIATIEAISLNTNSDIIQYGGITFEVEQNGLGDEAGSVHFLAETSSTLESYFSLNANRDNKVSFHKNPILDSGVNFDLNGQRLNVNALATSRIVEGASESIEAIINNAAFASLSITNAGINVGVQGSNSTMNTTVARVLPVSSFTPLSLNGSIWYDADAEKFKGIENGTTKDIISGGNDGTQDGELSLEHETSEYDFEIWLSNAKQANLNIANGTPVYSVLGGDVQYYLPFFIGERCNVNRLGVDIQTLDVGNMACAIYSNNGNQNYPSARIGNVTTGIFNTTGIFSVFMNINLEPGLYWFSIWTDTNAINTTIQHHQGTNANVTGWIPSGGDNGPMSPVEGYLALQGTNILPTNPPDDMVNIKSLIVPALFAKCLVNSS